MGRMSREKGKRGEREIAEILRNFGYDARRGQQFSGANGDADVVGLPGVHIEVKRVERFALYDALKQSMNDSRPGEMPVVFHRKSREGWVVVQPIEDWMDLYRRGYHVSD